MDGHGRDDVKDTSKWVILMFWWKKKKSTEIIYFEVNVTGYPVPMLQIDKARSG